MNENSRGAVPPAQSQASSESEENTKSKSTNTVMVTEKDDSSTSVSSSVSAVGYDDYSSEAELSVLSIPAQVSSSPDSLASTPSPPPRQKHQRDQHQHHPANANASFDEIKTETAESADEVSSSLSEREQEAERGSLSQPEMGQLFSRAGRARVRSSQSSNVIYGVSSSASVDSVGIDGLVLSCFDPDGGGGGGGGASSDPEPNGPEYRVPIVGYEINEERARFTIYKVQVEHSTTCRRWFVFRRYTDFARLNKKLKTLFPNLKFTIPPKRWFGDNFDTAFLEDRVNGLQSFVNSLMMNEEVMKSHPVKEFFCMDDPPGPDDGFEESRALCESLEETIIEMQRIRREKDKEVELLKGEVSMLKTQMKMLVKSLRMECTITSSVLSRLQKAQDISASRESICSSEASGCKYSSLHNIIRDHSFNVTFVDIMEKSLGTLGLSNSASSLGSIIESCNATEGIVDASNSATQEESTSLPGAVKIPVTVHATMVENISRSTGDGSTGSSERLPPVGGINETVPIEMARSTESKNNNDDNVTVPKLNSPPLKSLIEENCPVNSSTPKKFVSENTMVLNGVTNITLEA